MSRRTGTAISCLAITTLLTAAGATTVSSAEATTGRAEPLVAIVSTLGFELTSQAKHVDGSVTAFFS
ncbi:MAG: hypothetical protein M3P04_05815, partial [Actinomycetota bacterium]|nr:hypothetical protein [Actinomycetota bacterium]